MALFIALGVAGLIVLLVAAMMVRRILSEGFIRRIARHLEAEPSGDVFREEMVADLPAPAKRYLLHAIKPGTPLARSVRLRMSGSLRSRSDAEWTRVRAEETLSAPEGFVWTASVQKGWKRFRGSDFYFNGEARARFWLWGFIPASRVEGAAAVRTAAGKLAIESMWMPSCLLPQAGAQWEAVDDRAARVIVTIGGEPATITLQVEPDGSLRRAKITQTGANAEGSSAFVPFQADVEEEREFSGYTVPAIVSIGWWVRPGQYLEFFKASLLEARHT